MRLIDLTGQKFGKLTVIKRVENNKDYGSKWLCKCDCGNEVIVFSNNIRRGNTQSCGCLFLDSHIKHKLYGTNVYKVWDNMRNRCLNPNATGFKNWGGRGITIFKPWIEDFQLFYDYVSKLPFFGENGRTLDRINNNGNYEPDNLRWATRKEQNDNKRKRVKQFLGE